MRRRYVLFCLVLSVILFVAPRASGEKSRRTGNDDQTFTTIDVPGAIFTETTGINSRGEMVGRYNDADGIHHGYLLSHGSFMTIDGPDSNLTSAIGINAHGDIVGRYRTVDGVTHAFLLNRGILTSIDFSRTLTSANDINDRGEITGQYMNDAGTIRGFLLSNNQFTDFEFPDAIQTVPFGINNHGSIVGWFRSPDQSQHGFLRRNGEFTAFDFPRALKTGAPEFPYFGINAAGSIVGSYCGEEPCPTGPGVGTYENVHGFLLIEDEFTSISVPEAAGTIASRINSHDQIVGSYRDASGMYHGYLLSGKEDNENLDN